MRDLRWKHLAIFVGLQLFLLWVYWVPEAKILWGDESAYFQSASRLTRGEAFDLPLLWPPLYPRFVAGLIGLADGSIWLVQLAQIALLAFVAIVVRSVTLHYTDSQEAADVATLFVIGYPPLVAFSHYMWPEIVHLALLAGAVWILVFRRGQAVWLSILGVLLGLALLTKSLLLPFIPILILPVVVDGRQTRSTRRVGIGRVLLVISVIAAVTAPVILSNYQRHGVAVISDSSLFNLWVGLNDQSPQNFIDSVIEREMSLWEASAPTFPERNEVLTTKISQLVQDRGTLRILREQLSRQYFRLFDKESFLTDQLPGGAIAAAGAGYRDASPAVSGLLRGLSYGMYGLLLVGAAFGLALAEPSKDRWWSVLLAFLLYNLLIFLFLHVKTRYRVQVLPGLAFLAGVAVHGWLIEGMRNRRWPSPIRLQVAVSTAIILLLLAFAG